jgi:hypothetical protein
LARPLLPRLPAPPSPGSVLAAKATELRGRRDELGRLLDETTPPDKPSPDVLKTLHDYVLHTADKDKPNTLRTLNHPGVSGGFSPWEG